jgi:uncharacterized metal-binding protein
MHGFDRDLITSPHGIREIKERDDSQEETEEVIKYVHNLNVEELNKYASSEGSSA